AYPTSTVTSLIGRPAPPIVSSASLTAPWNSTLTRISTSNVSGSLTGSTVAVTSTWNNTLSPSLTSTFVAWPTSPPTSNSAWTTIALSRTLCTSRWQNLTSTTSAAGLTSTWTSLVLTNPEGTTGLRPRATLSSAHPPPPSPTPRCRPTPPTPGEALAQYSAHTRSLSQRQAA
ncbi:uncharacterized protein LY79DRAFT_703539, partial [Colletotrichum navitas]